MHISLVIFNVIKILLSWQSIIVSLNKYWAFAPKVDYKNKYKVIDKKNLNLPQTYEISMKWHHGEFGSTDKHFFQIFPTNPSFLK
jgi:hypothetical protein